MLGLCPVEPADIIASDYRLPILVEHYAMIVLSLRRLGQPLPQVPDSQRPGFMQWRGTKLMQLAAEARGGVVLIRHP